MSSRMTFSLASIILIFALAFATVPAMAATGGPTVTITEYTGNETVEDNTGDAHTQERGDFRVKFTFSHPVAAPTLASTLQAGNAAGLVGTAQTPTSVTAITASNNKEFVGVYDLSGGTFAPATEVAVTIDADAVTGNSLDNLLGNQPGSGRFTLPALLGTTKVTVEYVENATVEAVPGAFQVKFTVGEGEDAPSPALTTDYIVITPKDAASIPVTGTGSLASDTTNAGTYTATVNLNYGVPSVTVGVSPGYAAMDGSAVTLPPPVTADQNPPAAKIEVSGHDPAERTYRISVTFTPAADSLGDPGKPIKGFDSTKLDIKDGSTPPVDVLTTVEAERKADNSYVAILKYDRLSTTPLTIKVDQDELETSNPDESAMVGEAGPGPGMDADPSVSITTSQHNATARTFKVDVKLTPGAKADGSAGDPITGFGLSDLKITDAGDVVVTATVVDERSTDNSYVAILQYNPLDALPLTVTTADDFMTSNADDDPAAMAMVPPADTGTPGPTPTPPGAPGAPTGLAASANQAADTVELSWTAPADDGGSAITGYMIDQTGAAAASYTATASPFTTPALAAGDYTFTVKATNANGTGPASNEAMATIDPAGPVVTNNPPSFGTQTIADIVIWKGHAYKSKEALPLATDDEGDTLQPYKVEDAAGNPLPAGLSLKANDAQERFIEGTATAAVAKTLYSYIATDSMGLTAKIDFNITVLDPIKPTAPTGVTAMEEGAVADPTVTPRTVNTNKVVVNWVAPVDATVTDHDSEIPFGAAITGYNVSHTNQAGNKVTYSVPKADAVTFMTPVLARGEYTFQVQAINGVGPGDASPLEHVSHNAVVADPPGRPTNLSAALVPNSRNVTLNWLAPADDGGAPITHYRIYVTDNTLGRTVQTPTFLNVTTVQIQNLAPAQYVFRVSAINSDGEGRQSDNTHPPTKVDPAPVTPPNNAPTWVGNPSIPPISGTVGMPITVTTLPLASDADGDTITYSVSPTLPTGLRFNTTTRFLSGTPAAAVTPARTYTYMARDTKGGSISLNFTIQVMAAPVGIPPTVSPPEAHTSVSISLSEVGMLGPNQFVVLARNREAAGILPGLPSQVVQMGLVNLYDFFANQGTISLHGPSPNIYNDVVISEIMWGLDDSLPVREHSQWIELYNSTKHSIDLSGFELRFHGNRVADGTWWDAPKRCIDVVGNAGAAERRVPDALNLPNTLFRTHWVDGALPWTVKGQGGQSVPGAPGPGTMDIISMTRLINYDRVENHLDNQRNARFVADPGRKKGLPFGYQDGNWQAAEHRNAWIASGRIATPGTRPQSPSVRPPKTAPGQGVIVNEIGNSSHSAYDWIELYNTNTSGEVNLKNWRLSYVYNAGTDANPIGREQGVLTFPNNDAIKIPAQTYLVIAASHPGNAGNDLAAGIDITRGAADQELKGLGARGSKVANYAVVSNLNIPNDARRALFILRNSKDDWKLGTVENIVDVMGTAFIPLHAQHPSGWTGYNANRRVFYSTEVWPLQNWAKGHGDVITDGPPEDFRAGFVYHRNGKNSGIGEHHVSRPGFTGVGYDRHAARNNENGGTPGYNNGAVKGDKSDWAGQVTFSEIMLATDELEEAGRVPRATRLPQWIEIYNNSMTEGVNLNNWYLEIQNDDSPDLKEGRGNPRNLHGSLRLPSVIIPPNQTVLIVSAAGLNSGNFPETRTINLYTNGTYRGILNLTARGDSVLSKVGFYIQLRDHKNNHVDEIGNLGVSRRTGVDRRDNFEEEWKFTETGESSELHSKEGHRTSLIRVYDERTHEAKDGLMESSWRRAADTNFRNVPSLTYFGNHRDFGTPGYRGGGPLPVSLSKFRPERLDSGEVVIRWITESELNNAGFNILRTETRDGVFQQVNTQLIKGHGTTSERNSYTWTDTTAKPNVVYYYQIQDVSLDGQVQTLRISRLKGNVSAEGKVTTTWGSLKLQD